MFPLEANTRSNFDQILINLGYKIDETKKECNVFKERAKTPEQNQKLKKRGRPDYVVYQTNTDRPLAVIEAKKVGTDINAALQQAIEYATALSCPLAFATNDTSIIGYHVEQDAFLKIDGAEIQQFVPEDVLIQFIEKGADISINPIERFLSKEDVLSIFKKINKFLRKEGLRTGQERFSAISDLLFLKLLSEQDDVAEFIGNSNVEISNKYSWDTLKSKSNEEIVDFLNDSIRPRLIKKYGDIFKNQFTIRKPDVLRKVIDLLDPLNLSKADTDIKGDAFEFFLKSLTNGNKDLGEYYTPRHIIKAIISLLDLKYGQKIYDPFCGTGGFLIEAFKYLSLRVDMKNETIRETVKSKSIYGREISSTARVAKMNMILFGDGSTNIEQMDSLENPVFEEYDVVVSNIPYSQETEHGALYKLNTENADAVCVQHMWDALKNGGRMAVVVPETFLYEGGVIEQVRKNILTNASFVSVISLPRGVFNPYTPTKTSVIIAEKRKNSNPDYLYFYVVDNDGFELGARRRPIAGVSDLRMLKSYYESKKSDPPRSVLVEGNIRDDFSLRPFDYMEHIPKRAKENGIYLKDVIKEKRPVRLRDVLSDKDAYDHEFAVLEVSQKGIGISSISDDFESYKNHLVVQDGDIVFNPHRINVGSIGRVYPLFPIMVVSPIYEVFRIEEQIDVNYLLNLLKSDEYKLVIDHYAIGGARPIFKVENLKNIKIPLLEGEELVLIRNLSKKIDESIKAQMQTQIEMEKVLSKMIRC